MYVSCILMVDYLFCFSVPFLIFCLILSLVDSGVLKFPTIAVALSFSPLSFCLMYFKISCSLQTHLGLCFLMEGSFYCYVVSLLVSSNFLI